MNRSFLLIPEVPLQSMANEAIRSYFAAQNAITSVHPLVSVSRAVIEARIDIATLNQQINSINQRLVRIERGGMPFTAVINDFFPHELEVLKPIYVCIEPDSEEFVATFHDADVSASGETHAEALCNLKEFIAMLFDDLSAEDPSVLGPGPKKQLDVLNRFLSRSR